MVYSFGNLFHDLNTIYQSNKSTGPTRWTRHPTVHGTGVSSTTPRPSASNNEQSCFAGPGSTNAPTPVMQATPVVVDKSNASYSNTSTSSRPSEGSPQQHVASQMAHGGSQEEVFDDEVSKMNARLDKMNFTTRENLERRRSSSAAKGGQRTCAGGSSDERFGHESGMASAEFRRRGRSCVDWIADYNENIHNRRVVPSIEPGYLRELIPTHPPHKAETFEKVMHDFESYIMPGVTHWQHPRFHAYFPAGNSYPSILADMLSDALGCMGFSWAACPAMTELEMIMLDWFGQMIGLPRDFLPFTPHGRGGGVIQGSASECNFVALLAARFEVMKELRQRFPFVEEGLLMSKLIAYCSKEAHSSVEKAAMIGMVKLRILETDSKFRLRGDTLQAAITEDRNLGLIPFFVSTTLGTTSVCSFDVLSEVGPVCTENDLWLHVDAAYAGSAMVCPEFRYLMNGIEHAMSFNTNPNKWMLVNFDCSTMWVKDRFKLTQALVVDPLYLQHSWTDKAIDYRHWGIPLSRRFRSLKLWFVIRMYGVEGIQTYIRSHVRLAKKFEALLLDDDKFEIVGDVLMGLVCFRLRTSDELNQCLLTRLNSSGQIHMVPASLSDRFVIRFCVCHENATEGDIRVAYDIIRQAADNIMHESVAEPIVENYELEQWEEKHYHNQPLPNVASGALTDSASLQSQKSVSNQQQHQPNTSFESAGGASGGAGTYGSPPLSADVVVPPGGYGAQPQPPRGFPPYGAAATAAGGPLADSNTSGAAPGRRRMHTLAEKRSFLVRMVSDPKCYNPKIVRHLNMRTHKQMSQDVYRDRTLTQAIAAGSRSSRPFGAPQSFFGGKYSQMSVDQEDGYDEEGDAVGSVACEQIGLQTPM